MKSSLKTFDLDGGTKRSDDIAKSVFDQTGVVLAKVYGEPDGYINTRGKRSGEPFAWEDGYEGDKKFLRRPRLACEQCGAVVPIEDDHLCVEVIFTSNVDDLVRTKIDEIVRGSL